MARHLMHPRGATTLRVQETERVERIFVRLLLPVATLSGSREYNGVELVRYSALALMSPVMERGGQDLLTPSTRRGKVYRHRIRLRITRDR